MSEYQDINQFIDRFFSRYTKEEFDEDLANGGEDIGDVSEDAVLYFSCKKPLNKHREAVISVRLGGISTRTIRNWKKGENIYSERSSKVLNGYLDQCLSPEIRIDRRKLAWLWLAFRFKMSEEEAALFLKNCMGGQELYALDLYELVLRTALRLNSRMSVPIWDFFDAMNFAIRLQGLMMDSETLIEKYRSKTLEQLKASSGDAAEIMDMLALIYEDALNELHTTIPHRSSDTTVTQILEDRWTSCFLELAHYNTPGAELETVEETKADLETWAYANRKLFWASYLSWILSILCLLIEYAGVPSKCTMTENFFEEWYFDFSAELAAGVGDPDFPADVRALAEAYEYAEGESFAKYAKEKFLIYFGRLLDPIRVSRRRFIEYWYVAHRGRMNTGALNELLERHRFRLLHEGETPAVTEKLFRFKW